MLVQTWQLPRFGWGDPAIRDQRLHDHDQRKTRSRTRSRIAEINPFLQITISRKTIQFLVIANCRKGPLSANHDRKKCCTISQENSTISRDRELQKWATFCKSPSHEKLHNFSRKTVQFLVIANCRNGPFSANHDRKKNFTLCQEKLYNFSWSRIAEKGHFLQITIARNTLQFLKKNYTISRDRELQKWATFCKSRSQEKLCSFFRKLYSFS